MKQLLCLIAIIVLVQCEKQSTEPEIKYYDVMYSVWSAGDTTQIMYLDENEEYQLIEFAHNERHETWQLEFKVEAGANLLIMAESRGYPYNQYVPVVYAWCYIYVDGGVAVASDAANCNSLEESGEGCTYWEILDYYDCMASASYKILK